MKEGGPTQVHKDIYTCRSVFISFYVVFYYILSLVECMFKYLHLHNRDSWHAQRRKT